MAYNFKNLEEYYKSGKNRKEPNTTFTATPEKPHIEGATFAPTPEKQGYTPSPMPSTPEKQGYTPAAMGQTPEKSTQQPLNPMIPTPEKSTQQPLNPMIPTPEKTTQEPELFAGLANDRIPMFGAGSYKDRIQHLNNNQSQFVNVKPGAPMSFDMEAKTPQGGSSIYAFTRVGYNKQYEMKTNGAGELVPSAAVDVPKARYAEFDCDMFYKKVGNNDFVSLRDEAQRNNPRSPLWGKQPFVQRGIQRGKDNPAGPLERINKLTAPVIDLVRVSKFMVSPKGLLFNIKQAGLQLSNPKKQFGQVPMPNADRIYNPLALAAQIPLNAVGIHGDRHSLGQLNPPQIRYENVINTLQLKGDNAGDNRLKLLGQDMESGLFKSPITQKAPALKGLMKLYTKFTTFLSKLKGRGGEPIPRLSGLAGPNSFFGIGSTTIYKSTSGIKRAPVFLYSPEDPYYKQRAAEHFDDGKISEAAKGSEGKPGLEELSDSLTIPMQTGQSARDLWQNFPETEGDIDAAGTNTGKYKTRDYKTISEGKGNDAADDKYGNPDLESWDQSKFSADPTEGPKGKPIIGDDKTVEFPPSEGIIDTSEANAGEYKTKDYQSIAEGKGNAANDNKYGNPLLENWEESKFTVNPDDGPKAKPIIGDDKTVEFPAADGDSDASGKNLGKYKTKTYKDIAEEKGNDTADNKYGNPDLINWKESKFGEDVTDIPKAKKNTGDELTIEPPASSGEAKIGDPNKTFDLFGYEDIGKFRRTPKSFRDFRTKDENDSSYANKSFLARLNIPDYGASKPGESEDDDVNSDFVKVEIAGIKFRSYIKSISDSLSPSWTSVALSGNAANAYIFDKIGRSFSIEIQVPAFTSVELKNNYKKLNKLMGKASPSTHASVAGGQFHNITVGSLWQSVPFKIDKLDYKVDLEAGWDIGFGEGRETSGNELPMHFDISMDGTFLVNQDGKVWKSGGSFFRSSIWA